MENSKGKEEEEERPLLNGAGVQNYQTLENSQLGFFTGVYAAWNVPMKFQELLIQLVKLRKNLEKNPPNFSDYIGYFTETARVLERFYQMIQIGGPSDDNDPQENINLRIAKNHDDILKQIEKIKEEIKSTNPLNKADCYDNLAEAKSKLAELRLHFTYAVEGSVNNNRGSIQITAEPKYLQGWINAIGASPSVPPKWYFLRYAHVYAKRHIQAAKICVFFILSALAQATAVWVMTDRSLPSNERRPLHAYIAFPFMIALMGAGILLAACIKAYRKHTRPFEATAYENREVAEEPGTPTAEETPLNKSSKKDYDTAASSTKHYEKYHVPSKFHALLEELKNLRNNLEAPPVKFGEYTEHFTEIAKVLGKVYLILEQDDLREGGDTISAIDLRISNNNTIIGTQLAEINRKIKEGYPQPKNMSQCFDYLSRSKIKLAELGERFAQAIAGHKNSKKYPPPIGKKTDPNTSIIGLINTIGATPMAQPKWNFIRYAHVYAKRHTQAATICVFFVISALVEAAVFWIMTDMSLPSNKRRPTQPYIVLPFAVALTGVGIFVTGLIKSYRQLNTSFEHSADAVRLLPSKKTDLNQLIRERFEELQRIYNGEGSSSMHRRDATTTCINKCRSYLADHEAADHDWELDEQIRDFFQEHQISTANFHFPGVSESASLQIS